MSNSWQETGGTVPKLPPGLLQEAIWEATTPTIGRPHPAQIRGAQKRGAPQDSCQTSIVLDGFRTGEYTLRPHHYPKLMGLTLPAPAVMVIRGHTDNQGDQESNLGLSITRVYEVRNWLFFFNEGKPIANAVRLQGVGQLSPIASNATEAGRSRNRRVEIILCQTQPPPLKLAKAIQSQMSGPVAGETALPAEVGEIQSEDSPKISWYVFVTWRWDGNQWNVVEQSKEFQDTAANAARAYDGWCAKYRSSDPATTAVQCLVWMPTSQRWVLCNRSPGTLFCGRLEHS
jgi:outer membrane protein OmpA-like peptidoglycan-associated protein